MRNFIEKNLEKILKTYKFVATVGIGIGLTLLVENGFQIDAMLIFGLSLFIVIGISFNLKELQYSER